MRNLLAVLLTGVFFILFFIATTVNQVVDTASDADVVTGMLHDAEMYDYVYDNIVGNLVHDMVEKGIEVNSGLGEESAPAVLKFDDIDAASLAITDLIETLLPREYVQEKFEESLNDLVPYARGQVDEFTIDLEVQERVRSVPAAARKIVSDLELTERVIEDLLVPQLDSLSDQVTEQALGISFTPEELETNARLIFAPEWLEGQLFGAIDEVTPYFAGDTDTFTVKLQFGDRIVVAGQLLKDKLSDGDTLYNLVFSQVVDPLIQQTVAQSTSVGFGISLTEVEVVGAFEVIAPPDWVQAQGEGVIDSLIGYLAGTADSLGYSVDLSDRKVAATGELQDLARKKLSSTLGDIGTCTTPADVLGASQDLASRQLPRCVAGGQATIDVALATFGPIMDAQVSSFIDQQVPSVVSYTQADFDAQLGGSLDSINEYRDQIIEGVSFTEQDLTDAMSTPGDRQSRADAEEALRILADGVLITEKNITDNLSAAELLQLDDVRGYVKTALSVRWLLWVLVLLPLLAIAMIGGRDWASRLKWAGGVAVVCGLLVYGGIAVAWSFNSIATEYLPDYGSRVSDEFMDDYPRLSAELLSGELNVRFERALGSWQQGWRNQTVPGIIAGLVAFAIGIVLPKLGGEKGERLGGGPGYTGSSASAAASTGFSIPKDWGDDPEGGASGDATDDSGDKPGGTAPTT
ncbi:MAG TPA: hypothetical protein EYQ61_07660 [Dehalococcoidia bacterium]|nr:hypothetical protein [Dehalococcoidia bacterium]HIK90207.1 hypothetical protein [Dehalococcoidia bacterium]